METVAGSSDSSLIGWFFRRPTTLNSYLIRLIIAGLVPLLCFSVFMMVLFARQEQAERQRGLKDTARALALAIDQEIESSVTNLTALATSEPLDFGAVQEFRVVAGRFLRTQNSWKSVSLFDPRGRRLTNIAKPLSEDSGGINSESLNGVLRTRQPVISDFPVSTSGESGINIHVPVVREQTIIYVLTAAIEPGIFTEILTKQQLPREWLGTLFDSKKNTVAITLDAANRVGKPIGGLLEQVNLQASEQFIDGVAEGGRRSFAAVSRSQRSGWYVAVTVPSSEVNTILYRSLAMVGGGGLFLLIFGLGVALIFARQVARSIEALSRAAHDLGRGEPISLAATSHIAELEGLAQEMERAGKLLSERRDERDRVEAALRKQESFLQRQADLLNLANEAIFARELDGRIVYWNRGAEELYGYSQEEAIGRSSQGLLATEFPDGWTNLQAVLLERGEWTGELKQRTRHGQVLEVDSRFKLIYDRAGERILLECIRDITGRKQFARRLSTEHAVTLALAESETLEAAWSRILKVMGEGLNWELGALWMVNKSSQMIECMDTWQSPSKHFASCNACPPLARGVGLPGRVWAGEKSIWIADVKKDADTLRLSFPVTENLQSAFAFPIHMRNEVLGVIEFFSTAFREPDEELLKVVQAIGGEIGQFVERMRAEAALRQSEEHLRNQAQELELQLLASGRLVAVGELTASMAHEFNNPLGIILGFAQALLANMDPADADYHHVQIIAEEAKRCEILVQELLEFGRPKDADFVPTDIEQIVQKTVDLVQTHAAKNHVETALNIDGQLPRIYADPQQVQQVLLNLSLNAVDAMPKGGILTLGATVNGANQIIVTVADTGIGIDAEILPRIFQPFFTSKKRRGLGLGLPICDRIVKSHNGRIEVSSEPGRGTIFKIHFPVKPAATMTLASDPP